MTSARDTVFILENGRNFYRYIKKDPKTKLIFDAYIADPQTLPRKLKNKLLHLTADRSKPLVLNDSSFASSLMLNFKRDSISSLIFVYYLD